MKRILAASFIIWFLLSLTNLSPAEEITPETKNPFTYYKIIAGRNFFKAFEQKTGIPPELEAKQCLSSLTLTGIIIVDEEIRVIMEDKAEGKSIWIKVGEEIEGAKLIDVLKNKAIFLKNGEKVELLLKKEEKPVLARPAGRRGRTTPRRRRPSRSRTRPRRSIPREGRPPIPPMP